MDIPFIYDKYVINRDFIGRKSECLALTGLLANGENVVLSEPPRTGKKSLIQQTLFEMRLGGSSYSAAVVKMFNTRKCGEFLTRFAGTVIRSMASSPEEYEDIVSGLLEGTHFVFDRKRFADHDEVVSLNWDPDRQDMEATFALPFRLGEKSGTKIITVLDEFQSILSVEGYETILDAMEKVMKEYSGRNFSSIIFCGSKVNAMDFIFRHKGYFHRIAEHLPLHEIDEREILEHIRRGFLKGGKDIEKELAAGICRLFRRNIWYINHFCAICDSLSKGYINQGIMMDALNAIISIHEPRFMDMMDSLTGHQRSFLKAALDGVVKFSASEVIEQYSLNSSANVKRLKDALMKKEILTFNEKEEPVILDPLFEYWVRKYYFETD